MFNLGFAEIVLLFVIGLLVLGPKQLPQVARVLGRMAKEVKSAIRDFNSEVEKTNASFKEESETIQSDIKQAYQSLESKDDSRNT